MCKHMSTYACRGWQWVRIYEFRGWQLVRRVCVDPRKHWEVKVEKVRRPTDLIGNSGEGLGLTEEGPF